MGLIFVIYFSSPGLSWDAMLKMTDVKVEKISDIGKYLFTEKDLRGGISYIAKRYLLSEYLSYEGFEWLKNVDEFDVMSINEKRQTGYFLEVDLKYPDTLHELHNHYPLAPEKNCCF